MAFLKRIEWKIDGRDLVRGLTADKNELVRLVTLAKRTSLVESPKNTVTKLVLYRKNDLILPDV